MEGERYEWKNNMNYDYCGLEKKIHAKMYDPKWTKETEKKGIKYTKPNKVD